MVPWIAAAVTNTARACRDACAAPSHGTHPTAGHGHDPCGKRRPTGSQCRPAAVVIEAATSKIGTCVCAGGFSCAVLSTAKRMHPVEKLD